MSDIVARLRHNQSCRSDRPTMLEAADELERLREEVAALRADADRYRWLRDTAPNTYTMCPLAFMASKRGDPIKTLDDEEWVILFGEQLDAAIDAARGGE